LGSLPVVGALPVGTLGSLPVVGSLGSLPVVGALPVGSLGSLPVVGALPVVGDLLGGDAGLPVLGSVLDSMPAGTDAGQRPVSDGEVLGRSAGEALPLVGSLPLVDSLPIFHSLPLVGGLL
jgi:hypothetical protein